LISILWQVGIDLNTEGITTATVLLAFLVATAVGIDLNTEGITTFLAPSACAK